MPNLFPKDEISGVLDEVRGAAKAAGAGETGEQVRENGLYCLYYRITALYRFDSPRFMPRMPVLQTITEQRIHTHFFTQLYAFFLERVRTNLHVILCLSPVGETFRERCRMFPGLVNCTTIDW